ncbi:hypothetical protein RclHR1_09720001 [Rhizophagus clarus]|uniref:Aspartic peptidase domain-containing protein n=1 Tax=Rhizophagus clarus TaxID=94130 RepID=A0A2Z6SR64_9GLOM|nr:hypothetical protein RclHR1_09720001 [Rhizophagus clarus]GES72885.1 aspartic peptidase domain-containing protein [Rhizophagus clarus]
MKLNYILLILSAVVISNINAEPLPEIELFKRHISTDAKNALSHAKQVKESALKKYEFSKKILEKASSKNIKDHSFHHSYEHSSDKQSTTILKDIGFDVSYYGKVLIGNQKFNMLMDTGSSNIWVPNKNCTSASCRNHNDYDSDKSPTFTREGNAWSITYGTGSASGVTGKDNVKIAGFTAKKQIFGLAYNVSTDFVGLESDGILGLAFNTLNTMDNGAPTVVDTLIAQKSINPLFSFHLARVSDFDDVSTLTLGGVDKSKFKGSISFNPVIPTPILNEIAFWLIAAQDASVNGNKLGFTGKKGLIDTGTSVILMPDDDAKKIHAQIPGSAFDPVNGVYTIPCKTTAKVAFIFNGVSYTLDPRDLILSPENGTTCVSNIFPGFNFDGNNDIWLMGDPFLKNVYSVFNVGKQSVGFAHNK